MRIMTNRNVRMGKLLSIVDETMSLATWPLTAKSLATYLLQILGLLLVFSATILAQEDRLGKSCNLAITGGPGKDLGQYED